MNGTTKLAMMPISRKVPKGSALKSALSPEKVQREILNVKGDEKQPYKKK